jgi:hypothetical protein
MMILVVVLLLCLLSLTLSYRIAHTTKSHVKLYNNLHSIQSKEYFNIKTDIVSLSRSSILVNKAYAADTKPSYSDKEAAAIVKQALDATKQMSVLASEKKYNEISALFDTKPFLEFENACTILTRSEKLSADDRKALGTIKRYGVVADAIIMLGGIKGELKSGNVKVTDSGTSLQKAIEDDEDDEDDEEDKTTIKVNYPEIQRFIKLSYDSIADIYRIASQVK